MDIKEVIIKRIKETEDSELILTEWEFNNCSNSKTELHQFLENIDNKYWEELEPYFIEAEVSEEVYKREQRINKEVIEQISKLSNKELKKAIKQYEEGSETGDEWDFFPFTDKMLLFLDLDDDNHSKLYKLFKTELDNR